MAPTLSLEIRMRPLNSLLTIEPIIAAVYFNKKKLTWKVGLGLDQNIVKSRILCPNCDFLLEKGKKCTKWKRNNNWKKIIHYTHVDKRPPWGLHSATIIKLFLHSIRNIPHMSTRSSR